MTNIRKSETISELAKALSKAQGELKPAEKRGFNKHYGSYYATLEDVMEATLPALAKNGLSVAQFPSVVENGVLLETMLMHNSGEWLASALLIPISKRDAHGIGIAVTYGRRFGLASLVGITAVEDDDGNSIAAPKQNHTPQPKEHAPVASPQDAEIANKKRKMIQEAMKDSRWTAEQVGAYMSQVFGKTSAGPLTDSELNSLIVTIKSTGYFEAMQGAVK